MTEPTAAPTTAVQREPSRVLIVDDDAELCDLVGSYLTARGFAVECEGDGLRGEERARSGDYALVVLDVMLPSLDGFEVLKRLRASESGARVPVLMLTAHGDEVDRIVGLELGADDYLPKPFNPRELLARARAILRRAEAGSVRSDGKAMGATATDAAANVSPPAPLRAGDVELDARARTVKCAGQNVELTATEFDLLAVLLRLPNQVIAKDKLVREALGRKLLPFDRSLDMHVSKLRRKLGPLSDGADRIKTVRAVGFIFVTDKD